MANLMLKSDFRFYVLREGTLRQFFVLCCRLVAGIHCSSWIRATLKRFEVVLCVSATVFSDQRIKKFILILRFLLTSRKEDLRIAYYLQSLWYVATGVLNQISPTANPAAISRQLPGVPVIKQHFP